MSTPKPYKPFTHQWAYDAWEKQQQMHWIVSNISLSSSIKDWDSKLSDDDKRVITELFRFFTQADIEVGLNYNVYLGFDAPHEVNMMLTSFANMETIHVDAYSYLIESLGLPESEYGMFIKLKHIRDKYDHILSVRNSSNELVSLAVSGAFIEGVQLFSTFALLFSYSSNQLMAGMGQIIAYSVRDEDLHAKSMIKLFNYSIAAAIKSSFISETDKKGIDDDIYEHLNIIIELEMELLDVIFKNRDVINGLTKEDLIKYIKYIANERIKLMDIEQRDVSELKENPLPFMDSILNLQEHANQFDIRSTSYAKGGMSGDFF